MIVIYYEGVLLYLLYCILIQESESIVLYLHILNPS